MKSSYQIETELGPTASKYKYLIDSDRETVDKKDPYDLARINYQNRLDTIVDLVKKTYPVANNIKVGEFGCAQGIIALTLAEAGYSIAAFDINQNFLEYAKQKYEKGDVSWHQGDITTIDFPKESLEAAILGEVVEHCAYPEEIIAKVVEFLKPGGILVVTTPNANRILTLLPHFSEFKTKEARLELEKWQFGPDSSNHLFLFSQSEINLIIPENCKIISQGYLGGTILINRHNLFQLKLLPVTLVPRILKFFCSLGIISDLTCHNIYTVIKRL